MRRLSQGGQIDRSQPLRFFFDGKAMTGFAGDTLASALLANGVSLVGRSFKYHRPRGIYGAGVEEPNALVSIGEGNRRRPNIQATMIPLKDGLIAHSQNRWPSLRYDLQSVNQLVARFLGAGFYYKTFMGPVRRAWMAYEHLIRRAAGLGMPPTGPAPRSRTEHHHCNTLVVGGGLAGLTAALDAARDGKVLLAEQDMSLGGMALSDAPDSLARVRLAELLGAVKNEPNIQVLKETQVFGAYDHGQFGLVQSGSQEVLHLVTASNCVIATGALERGIALPGNDLPGVMLASAARIYLRRYGVLCGHHAVIFANNDSAADTAQDLKAVGCDVTVVDIRQDAHISSLRDAGVTVVLGTSAKRIIGRGRVQGVELSDGRTISCDLVCLSGGWTPSLHLTSHLGHKPVWSDAHAAFLPADLPDGIRVTGAAAGDFRIVPQEDDQADTGWQVPIAPLWQVGDPARSFVDLQNDVTAKDIMQAYDEGFHSVEHLKRYTTLGMGTDQGRGSNVIGLAMMANLTGQSIPDTGTTTFRPPFSPVSLGALAGDSVGTDFHMRRRSPLHGENLADGAQMIHSGLWERPWFYLPNGADVDSASLAEMKLVRSDAALCDVSSLGKIDVQGPDAAEFLNRIYANPFFKLPVGRARWGVMLRDDGYVFDDGTTSRLSQTQFFMTTTTAKAGQVLARMEFLLDTEWSDLRVHVTPVTDHWAAMALAGPTAREVLQKAVRGDVSDQALPFLGVSEDLSIADVAVRVLRVSFSGEMSYEIYAPAFDAPAVWRALRNAGAGTEGLEALGALRIEKGHISGSEFDGTTTMDDLGLSGMFNASKPFIGKVMAGRSGLQSSGRLQLVGLEGGQTPLNSGAVLCRGDFVGTGEGRITSATYSPTLNRYIALALLRDGQGRHGESIKVLNPARGIEATAKVRDPHFLDSEGGRMRG